MKTSANLQGYHIYLPLIGLNKTSHKLFFFYLSLESSLLSQCSDVCFSTGVMKKKQSTEEKRTASVIS